MTPEMTAEQANSQTPADSTPKASKPKTAIVVIHGMGEQQPMETLRGLVNALWVCDPDITGKRDSTIYSKPDSITGSFELRRITTRNVALENGVPKRADFFEFYWAHLMTGNTVKSVTSWLISLLIRKPTNVPVRLRLPWLVGIVLFSMTVLELALAGAKAVLPDVLTALHLPPIPAGWYLAASVFTLVFSLFSTWWLAPVAGDAARYLSPTPENVAARQTIREAGVDLLTKLHGSGNYDRIIVIGHSLGSVIGYDVLNYAWGRLSADDLLCRHEQGSRALETLGALEKAAGTLCHASQADTGAARVAYRMAQRAYQTELRRGREDLPPIWMVTDFITLGCPLSKGDVLLAKDNHDFGIRKRQRELPTCPPWLEKNDAKNKRFRFSYPIDETVRIPHHAAIFGPVVWTNVYFENFLIVFGDIISGAVAPRLGRGVLDVRLKIHGPVFRHLDYWKDPKSDPPRPWLRALRRATNLKCLDDQTLWGEQAESEEIKADDLPNQIRT